MITAETKPTYQNRLAFYLSNGFWGSDTAVSTWWYYAQQKISGSSPGNNYSPESSASRLGSGGGGGGSAGAMPAAAEKASISDAVAIVGVLALIMIIFRKK